MKIIRKFLALTLAVIFIYPTAFTAVAAETGVFVHESPFSSGRTIKGMFSSFTEEFLIDEWNVRKANLVLSYSTTPLLQTELSDITISVNGRPFYSQRLEPSGDRISQFTVPIPLDAIRTGSNILEVETYLRTSPDDPCKDDTSGMSWMVVYGDSMVSVEYAPNAYTGTVYGFYRRFSSIDALENRQSAVMLPESMDDAELTGAGLALSGVSANASLHFDRVRLLTAKDGESFDDAKYYIYIADYDKLVTPVKSALTEAQSAAARENAIMALVSLENGSHVLAITGKNAGAMVNAANLLGNRGYMSQLSATWLTVKDDDVTGFSAKEPPQFAPLTEKGRYIRGAFRQSATFSQQNYSNRIVGSGSTMEIKFRYSENLDFTRSLMTAYVNGTPVGSKKLMMENASDDAASFAIPADIDIHGNYEVEIAFDLQLKDVWCVNRREDMPWAYISNESATRVNWQTSPYLLFEYFPGPFLNDGRMNNVTVVLPDSPSDFDLEAMRAIITSIGRGQRDNSGSLTVLTTSGAGDLAGRNVIVIGKISSNPIAWQNNDKLYFKFSPDGTTVQSNEKLLLDPDYGATLGVAQLLRSPFSGGDNALLVISGVGDEGVAKAASYLSTEENIWSIYGDAYIAGAHGVQSYRFKEDNIKSESLLTKITNEAETLRFAIIGGGVLLLLIVAAVLLIIRNRKGVAR